LGDSKFSYGFALGSKIRGGVLETMNEKEKLEEIRKILTGGL